MRASNRRSHHSVSFAAGLVNLPRRITPLDSRRRNDLSISDAGSERTLASSLEMTGPEYVIQPVTSVKSAPSLPGVSLPAAAGDPNSGSGESNVADGKI